MDRRAGADQGQPGPVRDGAVVMNIAEQKKYTIRCYKVPATSMIPFYLNEKGKETLVYPCGFTELLSGHSWKHKRALRKFSEYLTIENGYDFPCYHGGRIADDGKFRPFLWVESLYNSDFDLAFGGGAMRETNGKWCLEWVWIHPFKRRKGVLTATWPNLKNYYGDFLVNRASEPMRRFLEKQGQSCP